MEQNLPAFVKNGYIQNYSFNEDEHENKKNQKFILKNMLVTSICYFLFYMGYWSLANLQSTMNSAGGLGDYSQAVIYGFSMFSSLLFPDLLIGKFGSKKVLVICTLLGCPYIAANMYLNWNTMLFSAALYGMINGPFVASQAFYVDEMATRFQKTVTQNIDFIMASFFGMLGFFSEMTQVLGNVLIYYSLQPISQNVSELWNGTSECGINFLPGDNDTNSNLDPPPEWERLILVGSFLGCGLLSVIILAFFLDPLKNDLKRDKSSRLMLNRTLATIKFLRNPYQILLIPVSIYIGMEGPFYTNEVTQAYIACSWGVHHVGFVTICFGVCGAIASLLVGPLVKCISQMAVLLLAACANVSMCVLLFLWNPSPNSPGLFFLIAGLWGMGDAIWWSQVTALYGLMFPNDREAAFSNLYFWSFLGFFISYSYANYLSVAVKIVILLVFLLAGIVGYLTSQVKLKCASRREYTIIENEE